DCCNGFLHHRGVDVFGTDAFCRPILYGSVDATGANRRHRPFSEWAVDEPDRTQSNGCRGWVLGGKALSHPRSKSAVYTGVSEHPREYRHPIRQTAAAIAESECVCGTLCPDDQRMLSGADDFSLVKIRSGTLFGISLPIIMWSGTIKD